MTVKVVERKENEIQIPLPAKPAGPCADLIDLGERVQASLCYYPPFGIY